MRPTLQKNSDGTWAMLDLGPEPIKVLIRHCPPHNVWVDGFASITATTHEGLEERWRAIAASPFSFIDAVTAATAEDLRLAQQAEADGEEEGELEDCKNDMDRLRITRVLLRAAWNAALADAAEKIQAKRRALVERMKSPFIGKGLCEAEGRGLDFALQIVAITDAPALPFPRAAEVTTCKT